MLTSILSSNIYQALSKWALSNKEKNIIIDPLSCFIKLSLLNFYPEGTKISISNNHITFNEPGYLQGVIRTIKGDGRDDLHNIFNPLQKGIRWYWKDISDETKLNMISLLFDMTISGLSKLKKAYNPNSTIQHTLDYYLVCVRDKKIIRSDTTDNDNNNNNTDSGVGDGAADGLNLSEDDNNKIHRFLKRLWNDRELEIIIGMLNEFKTKYENKSDERDIENLILSITTFTENKERKLNEFLENHTKVLI